MAFTYVTITHAFQTAAELAAAGEVDFQPVEPMHNGVTVVAKKITAQLSGSGLLSQVLAANTDPGTLPTGTTYKVTERITGQSVFSYYIQVPHDEGATLDLRELAGWVGNTNAGAGVLTVNSEAPDGAGNLVLSASDLGAQPLDQDLTDLAALADGFPRRTAGTWASRTVSQFRTDLGLELLVTAPVTLTASGGIITPDLSQGLVFDHTATANVQLAEPINATNGQTARVRVTASGATRTLSFPVGGPSAVVIPSGDVYSTHLEFFAPSTWLINDQ